MWQSSQEYPVDDEFPQGSILGPTLFLLDINDLPDDFICDLVIYADDTTLYSELGFDNLCSYVAYVRRLTIIAVRMILDMCGYVDTYAHFFTYDFLRFLKFFWFL